ncbi:MAG: hypothetical protein LBO20_09240, partial [Bifidobacteriaceae bacterium]|nr:hypothetical protein [Bifidobacteriaceae bacterium]
MTATLPSADRAAGPTVRTTSGRVLGESPDPSVGASAVQAANTAGGLITAASDLHPSRAANRAQGRTRAQLEAHAAKTEAAIVHAEAQAQVKQHAKGKLSARERLGYLLDEGSFVELDALVEHQSEAFGLGQRRVPGDGVVTGYGTV